MSRPTILLDVDGPLNPWSARHGLPEGYTEHLMRPRGWETGKPLKVRLRASDGFKLQKLDCELIWATAWEEEANKWIGKEIGLPELPHIDWTDKNHWNIERLHWKTKRIVQWMNENRPGIPFIWLDDEVTKRDRLWIADSCAKGSTILLINPKTGLEDEYFERIKAWKNYMVLENLRKTIETIPDGRKEEIRKDIRTFHDKHGRPGDEVN